ncbi:fungal specific transcription factor domain-containing protein [Ophiostoma piceae UAMH 11346]|uniref:Fungal specific transcription factor domain-containing protein n=1 Tax=Ophiostoma piceae (strain UAMH 11346) TaxID=1262450 RepID=S3CCC8_OPHP1|nr:fungal specific transcription factor domain-containing protein [Ophiostoma piceae UAMH 11346]
MDLHRNISVKRPAPHPLSLPDAGQSFPSASAPMPERLRPPHPLQSNGPQQDFDAHHAGSPHEVPIVSENMFDDKQMATNNRSPFHPSGEKHDGGDKPVKRRMRGITSCLECRRRKMKCGRTQPCDHCHKSGRVCIYLGDRLDPDSQGKITEIKEKVSSLELQLQKSVVHQRIGSGLLGSEVPAYSLDPAESGLEISHMVTSDLIYDNAGDDNDLDDDEDDDEATNDMIDLGFKVGRMRMTERIGGLNRPRLAEEINVALSGKPGSFAFDLPPPEKHPGIPSHMFQSTAQGDIGSDCIGDDDDVADSDMNSAGSVPDFLRPSTDYIAPSSSALFGHLTAVPPVLRLLPAQHICDFLVKTYFTNVHPIASCLHQPTFEQQFREFLILVGRGRQPRRPRQALVFAVLFAGVVATDADDLAEQFDVYKGELVELVKFGVEASLGRANLLRTTSVEAMQSFVIYLVALCRDEVSRSHSILVGAAIRMAECMALHRDGSAFGLTSLETHVRRLIWHQLCFLDIRTCEAQGPRPTIHREDYDTFLPYNCNDEDLTLETDTATFSPKQSWSASFLIVLRFEVNEIMRVIWFERFKLERRKSHLTLVMAKIDKFCQRLNQKYEGYLDDSSPIKRYTKLVKELFICRMHVMVLHPYHSNTNNPLSERLHSSLIQSGIRIIEIGIELETNPQYAQWRWYLGAFMQYQIALLLATEAFHGQSTSEAGRISRCLDYVFDTEPSQGLHDKAQGILYEVMQKSATYCEFRKLRAPIATKQAVPQAQLAQSTPAISRSNTLLPDNTPTPHRDIADVCMVKNEAISPVAPSLLRFSPGSAPCVPHGSYPVHFPLPSQQFAQQHDDSLVHPLQQTAQNHQHLPQAKPLNQQHHLHHQTHQQHRQGQGQHQHQHQQMQYHGATGNGSEDVSRRITQTDATSLLSTEQHTMYAFGPHGQITAGPMVIPPAAPGSNMVFSGVANGEALWGPPQVDDLNAMIPKNT